MAATKQLLTQERVAPQGDSKRSKFELQPLAGALGACVFGIDASGPISDSTFADLYKAFLEYQVIFLKDQRPLSPVQHRNFASLFGDIDYEPFTYPFKTPTVAGHPEILMNVKEASDRSLNVGGFWHADVTYRERPHKAAILYAKEAPPFGGDTFFANQNLAYESLSPGMRELVDGLYAEHSSAMPYGGETARFASVSRTTSPRPEDRKFQASLYEKSADVEPVTNEHPVVRTHPETGKRCLYVNRGFTSRFRNMTPEESRPLLEFLFDHACRLEFTCRFKWDQDDIAVWDNRSTLHYALNDYSGYRREMHRISVHEPSRPA
jgi:taurine dioxygenase